MKLPSKTLERKLFADGYRYIIAVDEVGMGCLAGPVVVCAVLFDKKFFKKKHKKLSWLRDSKLLSAKQREEFVNRLFQISNFKFRVSYCYPKTVDKINIYQAARKAMKRAITELTSKLEIHPLENSREASSRAKAPTKKLLLAAKSRGLRAGRISNLPKVIVLIDGKTKIQRLPLEQSAIVKGDRKVFAIACASIIAKVFRDKMMTKYAKKFPGYGFEKHKGYGTKEHQVQLAKLGPCTIHRKSFAPVAKLI